MEMCAIVFLFLLFFTPRSKDPRS